MTEEFDYDLTPSQWDALKALRTPAAKQPRLSRYGIGVLGYSQTLDITRARTELDYRPQPDIGPGLARLARWQQAHDQA